MQQNSASTITITLTMLIMKNHDFSKNGCRGPPLNKFYIYGFKSTYEIIQYFSLSGVTYEQKSYIATRLLVRHQREPQSSK